MKILLVDYSGAIADFTTAIEMFPGNADAYLNRGIAKSRMGDKEGAIKDFKKQVELDLKTNRPT